MLKEVYADLHIHLGQDWRKNPIKISASPRLTLTRVIEDSKRRKGMDIIGIVDCHVPSVLEELEFLKREGEAEALSGGGLRFGDLTLILGSEIEIKDTHSAGPFHVLAFLPTLEAMRRFSDWLRPRMKNLQLSSQRFYGEAKELQAQVKQLDGLFVPAHVFTPFKSLYGRGVKKSMAEVLDLAQVDAMELGLSADSSMADRISELHTYPYLTNSDSHSLEKIGREYQVLRVKEASFTELALALQQVDGRGIVQNYGLNPYLGKYYETVCIACEKKLAPSNQLCPHCHSKKVVLGVKDRIEQLSDFTSPPQRPPYMYQVPLELIPGLGPKTLEKLLSHFGTEMNVVHQVPKKALEEVVSPKIAAWILRLRKGRVSIRAGGGGKYGRVIKDDA